MCCHKVPQREIGVKGWVDKVGHVIPSTKEMLAWTVTVCVNPANKLCDAHTHSIPSAEVTFC